VLLLAEQHCASITLRPQRLATAQGTHRVCHDVGVALQEIEIVLAEVARLGRVHLKHAPRTSAVAADHHVGGRDDAVVGVDVGQVGALDGPEVGEGDGPPGSKRLPAGVALIVAGEGAADHPGLPAHPGSDDEVTLIGAVFEHLAEGHAQALRAEPRPLGQHPVEVGPGERTAAELGQRPALA
jgi:hypothetical protein